jgi:hypothetical protein
MLEFSTWAGSCSMLDKESTALVGEAWLDQEVEYV